MPRTAPAALAALALPVLALPVPALLGVARADIPYPPYQDTLALEPAQSAQLKGQLGAGTSDTGVRVTITCGADREAPSCRLDLATPGRPSIALTAGQALRVRRELPRPPGPPRSGPVSAGILADIACDSTDAPTACLVRLDFPGKGNGRVVP